tara:strand:- start:103 stop:963 length:861 start_codon:yes stop_codon:yes gene_type:complete
MSKLSFGTAQIGMNYGIGNRSGRISNKDLIKIFNTLKKNNIDSIDTSLNYGNVEKRINLFNLKKFKITTKFKIPKKIKHVDKWIINSIQKSKKNLKIRKFYGILIHDINDLFRYKKEIIFALKKLKKDKIVKKIGISIYSINDFNKIEKFWKPDIIQIPLNVFDQRIILNNWIKKIKKKNIEIHVRSVFLQGILLLEKNQLAEKKFIRFKKKLNQWILWCKKNKQSKLSGSLNFVKKFNEINKVVIGVDNFSQFQEILNLYKLPYKISSYKKLNSSNLQLIDPRKW